MQLPERTSRQRVKELLMAAPMSSLQLAKIVGITEREVEGHIGHIIKSVERDRSLHFKIEPCECRRCGFTFSERKKISRPSRCPRCRSEDISEPQFSIEGRGRVSLTDSLSRNYK